VKPEIDLDPKFRSGGYRKVPKVVSKGQQRARRCTNCAQAPPAGLKLSICGKCKSTLYCSRECQTADWASHKPACLVMRKLKGGAAGLDLSPRDYAQAGEALEAGGKHPNGHPNYKAAAVQYRLCIEKAQVDATGDGDTQTVVWGYDFSAAGTAYLALALKRLGRFEEAGRVYKKAVKLWKNYVDTIQAMDSLDDASKKRLVAHGDNSRRGVAANFLMMASEQVTPVCRNVPGVNAKVFKLGDKGTTMGGADMKSMYRELFHGFSMDGPDICSAAPTAVWGTTMEFELLRVGHDGRPSVVRWSSRTQEAREVPAPTSQREAGPGRYYFTKGSWACNCPSLGLHMVTPESGGAV